ncbi:MAG TPA: amidohydrolase family protein [Hyphomonas sp.]|nr:amidohydrolase family protein [Hyphomonas sp.]MCA8904469.1 amidohydrolase family protein [Hyphomonas sp.]MCB9962297.1 amidohydrolase family protein [Hyphomonas sp.]HPE48617.1 amidohydrolase family protein [Hyphomonas sp.]
MIRKLIASAAIAACLTAGALAETYAVKGKNVWTGTSAGTLTDGVVIIRDGRIVTVGGPDIPVPEGASVVSSEWVTPGLISAFSRTGIIEVDAEDTTNDSSAALSPFSVALNAADGFNPDDTAVHVTRLGGVTRIAVAPVPSTNLFAGQGFVADTSGRQEGDIHENAFVYMSMGEGGAGLAGGSRPAAWAQLRAAIDDARAYPGRYAVGGTGDVLTRLDAKALVPAAKGKELILVSASSATDLNALMDFAESEPALKFAVVGGDEAWRVADRLARLKIPVILDSFSNLPASFEQLAATQENAARLAKAGVPIAIVNLDDETHLARLMTQVAGNAVANGLDWDEAMKSLTVTPAKIYGLSGYGVLAPGAHADVVAWDGDPLEVTTNVDAVFIEGEAQPLTSRQTELRDRYMSLDESQRPRAYTRP